MIVKRLQSLDWRMLIAFTWVGALSLWMYQSGMWIYSSPSWHADALSTASAVLRSYKLLWLMCFSSALPFGIAWYLFSHQVKPMSNPRYASGMSRLTKAQINGSLCLGIVTFVFNHKIMPFLPALTDNMDRKSEPLLTFYGGVLKAEPMPPVLEQQILIGCLASMVVMLQAWGLIVWTGGTKKRLVFMISSCFIVYLVIPVLGVLKIVPTAAPKNILELDLNTPVKRGLIIGDSKHSEAAESMLFRYMTVHDESGHRVPFGEVRRSYSSNWDSAPYEEYQYLRCELCLLPWTRFFTVTGLPLYLNGEPPKDLSASKIIEIPRDPSTVRIYEPEVNANFILKPITEAKYELGNADWIILKIDYDVSMQVVRNLFLDLRNHGVRRIDLAVIPGGYRELPKELPMLQFEQTLETVDYQPIRSSQPLRRWVIAVQQYVPPPSGEEPDPRTTCDVIDIYDTRNQKHMYELDPPGSLPKQVRLPVDGKTRYGYFISILQGAVMGGAESIVLSELDEFNE